MYTEQLLIDAHHHLWALDGSVRYPWLEHGTASNSFLGDYHDICQPILVEDLQASVPEGYRLTGSVHCEAEADRSQAVLECEWITNTHNRQGLPSVHVGWAAFGHTECATQLDQQIHSPLFRGVRAKPVVAATADRVPQVSGEPGTLQDPRWCEGLAMLEERELSWDLRVPAWHLQEAANTLEGFPGLCVILNHTGLPLDRTHSGLATWRIGMQALADNPNVAVKLSELGTPWHDWSDSANLDLLCETLALFGHERCLFASNFPVSGLRVGYGDWLALVERAIDQVYPDSRQNILHDNAVRWYRMD